AMGQFVADYGSDTAEVHGIISLIVIKGRLQDSRWESDVSQLRTIAGVHRAWRVGPVILVHWLADFVQLPLKFKFICSQRLAQRIAVRNLQATVVAPFVRIPDSVGDGRQLYKCLLFGFRAHPGEI